MLSTRAIPAILACLIVLVVCGSCASGTDDSDSGNGNGDTVVGPGNTDSASCKALPLAIGSAVRVSPGQAPQLAAIISMANPGDTILLEDGTYDLNGVNIWITKPGVSLRSLSGNPDGVILDGGYNSTEIITVAASNVTVAEITLRRPATHAVHVVSSASGNTENTLIYRVRVVDSREQAIKINPHSPGFYVDYGEISCSTLLLTAIGRPQVNTSAGGCYTGGIDAHQARGWVIRNNRIDGFWCSTGLAEHAVHFWRGGRDTLVEGNQITNSARGIGFGLVNSGTARTYADNACPGNGGGYIGHYGGIIRNNFISASSSGLLNSPDGFDCGICLASSCNARVFHNSIVSTGSLFSGIEMRFTETAGTIVTNNLITHTIRFRDGGSGNLSGNLESASNGLFVDPVNGDLHLLPGTANAINRGVSLTAGEADIDFDGDLRDGSPDIGADEFIN